ncbi:hypothetical protein KA977_14510 [Candidatus Dependentiae bacterium]|nr:hypothetical protein [Candidatus Dependentiae bacterium]
MKSFLQCPECETYFENNFTECQKCPGCGSEICQNAQNIAELKQKFYKKYKGINFFAIGIVVAITLIVWGAALLYTSMQTKLFESTAKIEITINNFPFNNEKEQKIFKKAFSTISNDLILNRKNMMSALNKLNVLEKNSDENRINEIISKTLNRLTIYNDCFNVSDIPETYLICTSNISIVSSEPLKASNIINAILDESISDTEYFKNQIISFITNNLKKSHLYYTGYTEFYASEIQKTKKMEKDKTILQNNINTLELEYKNYYKLMKEYEYYIGRLQNLNIQFNSVPSVTPKKPIYPNVRQSSLAGLVMGLILGILVSYFAVKNK